MDLASMSESSQYLRHPWLHRWMVACTVFGNSKARCDGNHLLCCRHCKAINWVKGPPRSSSTHCTDGYAIGNRFWDCAGALLAQAQQSVADPVNNDANKMECWLLVTKDHLWVLADGQSILGQSIIRE